MSETNDHKKAAQPVVLDPEYKKVEANPVIQSHFTQEQIKELHEAFYLFDKDKNGKISNDEVGDVMRSLGMDPGGEEIENLMREVDTDGNGTIEFSEFVDMMVKRKQTRNEEDEIREAFKVFDIDGDGYLTVDELRRVMTCLGERLTDDEVNEMLAEADTNRDGHISYEEFIRLVSDDPDSKA